MINWIIGGILVAIIGGAVFYIVRQKRRGAKCIGCHLSGSCSPKEAQQPSGCSGCPGASQTQDEI